jgi:RimJ/RimL family protein N-acetyltransferase
LSIRPPNIDDESLVTDRLTLAPLRLSDAREMQAVLASPALYRYTGGSPPSLEQLTERYRHQIAGPDDPDVSWHNWIIQSRTTGSAVGYVQATVAGDTADIAWLVGVPWQRQAFAVEAASSMCAWLATLQVHRLTAHIHPDHLSSAKVAARLGLTATNSTDAEGEQIWSSQPPCRGH